VIWHNKWKYKNHLFFIYLWCICWHDVQECATKLKHKYYKFLFERELQEPRVWDYIRNKLEKLGDLTENVCAFCFASNVYLQSTFCCWFFLSFFLHQLLSFSYMNKILQIDTQLQCITREGRILYFFLLISSHNICFDHYIWTVEVTKQSMFTLSVSFQSSYNQYVFFGKIIV
jgi:hypothetical protein